MCRAGRPSPGSAPVQTPRSISSFRTIHRRKEVQAFAGAAGGRAGKEIADARSFRRPGSVGRTQIRLERAFKTSSAPFRRRALSIVAGEEEPSTEPDSRSIRCRSRAAQRGRVRESIGGPAAPVGRSRLASKFRTKAAGCGPIATSSLSIDCSTLATRPNASADAQKPTISRSSGFQYCERYGSDPPRS